MAIQISERRDFKAEIFTRASEWVMKRVIFYQEGIINLLHITIEPWIYEAKTDGTEKRNRQLN